MPKIVDKEGKRKQILEAAMRVFARTGVVKTRMAEIAWEAGIGKGTIYEYFRSKEEMAGAAFTYLFAGFEQRSARILKDEEDPIRQLERVMQLMYVAFAEEASEFVQIFMEFWAEAVRLNDPKMQKTFDLNAIYEDFRRLFGDIVARGIEAKRFRPVDARLMACSLIALVDGLFLQWILNRNLFDLKDATTAAIDSILHGLLLQHD